MRVLVTVWNGRVSPVFDVAGEGLLINIRGKEAVVEKRLFFPDGTSMRRLSFILNEKIDVLICGAVSRRVEMELIEKGIAVYSFISGEIDDVINGLLENRLYGLQFAMPGCRRGRKINADTNKLKGVKKNEDSNYNFRKGS